MGSRRITQVNELIGQELAVLMHREVEFDDGTLVTIVRVATEADLKRARIFLTVFPPDRAPDALRALKNSTRELQSLLNHRLVMKFVPRLFFHIESEKQLNDPAAEVDHLLHELSKEGTT